MEEITGMKAAIKELQDTMVVMAHLENRQSQIAVRHAELLADHEEKIAEANQFRRRTEQNLAEITDKLNGLSGT